MTHPQDDISMMNNQAILLRTVADTLTMDLAVAPMIVASEPGIGTSIALRGIAEGLGMKHIDVRCSQLDGTEFDVIKEDSLEGCEGSLGWLLRDSYDGQRAFIVLDEADSVRKDILDKLLKQISHAEVTTIVVLRVFLDGEEQALAAINEGLDIHRAHVPTARIAVTRKVTQPLLYVGELAHSGSKCGERYFSIIGEGPMDPEYNFAVFAKPDQSDDDMNEDLDAAFMFRAVAAVRLDYIDDQIRCMAEDIDVL